MLKYSKFFVIILIGVYLSGCTGKIFSSKSIFAPKPFRMGGPDREKASEVYLAGWDDGCETGLSTMVTGYYKSFYAYKQDPYMIDNFEYYKAWQDAYHYCRQYSFRFTWDAYDKTSGDKATENPLCILCPNELGRSQ